MPIYTFEDTKTGESWDDMMSISEKEKFLKKNKHFRQLINSINIIGGVSGVTHKTDSGWNDNLQRIAEAHPKSNLADRFKRRSIKEVKTDNVIKKHRNRIRKG